MMSYKSIIVLCFSLFLNSMTWAAKKNEACTIILGQGGKIDFGDFPTQQFDQLRKDLSVEIKCSQDIKRPSFKLYDNKQLIGSNGAIGFQAQYFILTKTPNTKGKLAGYYTISPWGWGNKSKGYIKIINSAKQTVSDPNPASLRSGALLKSDEKYSFRDIENKRLITKELIGTFEIRLAKLMITEGEIHGSFSLELLYD